MKSTESSSQEVESFISRYPAEVQEILYKNRSIMREVAPDAQEKPNYGIPTFTLNGNLVHYSGFKDHIGFYPTPSGVEKFKNNCRSMRGQRVL
jgi:uncharacterized protein YdhG (YjbR/CyaY superfamily)